LGENRKTHWQQVYESKRPTEVSWFQPIPEKSLQLIHATGVAAADAILDVGGGASTLVDNLLADGFEDVSVLDISAQALRESQSRLGNKADRVNWIESDITDFQPQRKYALWHDRAVFHFLTDATDRECYVSTMKASLRDAGHVILATFGPQGPLKCSGLQIRRYDIEALQRLLGSDFELLSHEIDDHETPSGARQQFLYSTWKARTDQGDK